MTLLPPSDLFILLEDPVIVVPEDVLVAGTAAPATPAAGADAAPLPPDPAPSGAPVPAAITIEAADIPGAEPRDFTLPAEDAFPTLPELDAILAANAHPAAGADPDAGERAAAAALLGIDPDIAADPALYAAALAAVQDTDADAVLDQWLSEAEVGPPPDEWPDLAGDWQVG